MNKYIVVYTDGCDIYERVFEDLPEAEAFLEGDPSEGGIGDQKAIMFTISSPMSCEFALDIDYRT